MKTKLLSKLMMLLLAAVIILPTGCRDDDDNGDKDINHFDVMTQYMQDNNLDLSDVLNGWITTATVVHNDGPENYYILDVRSSSDYIAGHLPGAVNTTFGNLLTEAENASDPILVICYTGQSAAHAVTALRLSGYSSAKSLKFGMSSWHSDFDSWSANVGNVAIGHNNWSAANNIETPLTFSAPEFTATAKTGEEILEERVEYMLTEGFKGISNSDVLNDPQNYFINNYWAEADVDMYGHISGAYRIKEDLTLADGGFLSLDPASTVVTYCWTGQTSSLITAYLTVLGYDAKSLKFGANGMIYGDLQAHKWMQSMNYNYVQ
ncbi:MAG: hypothetical protein K9H84_08220 [Bacteroidales bacterium]|nr:hypothetical protein [Bacteroidales bacterium]